MGGGGVVYGFWFMVDGVLRLVVETGGGVRDMACCEELVLDTSHVLCGVRRGVDVT